jgi:NACalpha-BTF3-like transcription factor
MSKVLRMIDFDELITWEHHNFIIEQEMKQQEESEDENGWDEEQEEWENEDVKLTVKLTSIKRSEGHQLLVKKQKRRR